METGWEERLWMGHDSFHYPTMAPGETDRHTVEYIRADVHEAKIATLKARVERLTKVLDGMCGLILQDEHLRRDEATDTPFFVIAVPSRGGMEIQKGVWFSRGTADKFLESQRHNYGRKAYVYCPSGGMSDLQKLYAMAKEFKARGEV